MLEKILPTIITIIKKNKKINNKTKHSGVNIIEYALIIAFICAVGLIFVDNTNNNGIAIGIEKSYSKITALLNENSNNKNNNDLALTDKPINTIVKSVTAKDLEALKNFNSSFYNENKFNGIEGVYRNGDISASFDQDLINKLNELGGAWLYSSKGKEIVYTTADISNLPIGTMVPAIYAQDGTDRYIVGYAYVNGNGQLATLGELGVDSYKIGTSGSYYSNATDLPAAYNNTSGTMSFANASQEYERIVNEYNANGMTTYNRDKDKLNQYDPFNLNNKINI